MVFLEAFDAVAGFLHGADGLDGCSGGAEGGHGRDSGGDGGAADGDFVFAGGLSVRGVEDEFNFAVFDGVDDVGTAFADFEHDGNVEAVFGEVFRRACGGVDFEAE